MYKTIYSNHVSGSGYNFRFHIEIPGKCPICNVAYGDEPIFSHYISSNASDSKPTVLYIVFYCPHCSNCFFAEYTVTPSKNMDIFEGHLCKVHPAITTISTFSDRIEKISPKFIEIYHQSEIAENTGLIEICGMGYRKALEFLVKDYAIAFNPDNESEIRNSNLSPCISNFIDNKRIKSLAMASAWIGNDETHYTRKHEDYDVGHLKLFISAVVSHIDSELAYRMAERLLSAPKK